MLPDPAGVMCKSALESVVIPLVPMLMSPTEIDEPDTATVPPTVKLLVTAVLPVAVKFNTPEDEIVKSVPSPSIFSPSSPKVNPMDAGKLISPPAPTEIVKSVPSDSIFSVPAVSNTNPTACGMCTSVVAVKFNLLLEEIVKSVPLPSIFSPSSPNVIPIFAGTLTSAPAVKLMSPVPPGTMSRSAFESVVIPPMPMLMSAI